MAMKDLSKFAQRWVKALESGKFKQAKGTLCRLGDLEIKEVLILLPRRSQCNSNLRFPRMTGEVEDTLDRRRKAHCDSSAAENSQR